MTTPWWSFFRAASRRASPAGAPSHPDTHTPPATRAATSLRFDIATDDPLRPYLARANAAVDIDEVQLDSPALAELRASGVKLLVPLCSQGELIGVLSLGPRLSEQEYSADDRSLLTNLAAQATPAVLVAQLVRQQQAEIQARERLEHELGVARVIQQTLLPKELPTLRGWQIAVHYQPAQAVGGDFYDFLELPDGRLVMVVGDVTDKGVPAALLMATTRSVLRGTARRLLGPGAALQRANDLLVPEMPANMFVTCLFAILDPVCGRLQFANAGHDLPYWRHGGQVTELRATGMPLGLMPGMTYEEQEVTLGPGDSVLLYSDGLVEAHNRQHQMYGFPRLCELMGDPRPGHPAGGRALLDYLLADLASFTGSGWVQEDDITLVNLQRTNEAVGECEWQVLADFTVPSNPGNERQVMDRVAAALAPLAMPAEQLEQVKTAVSEATMNAIEHGNLNNPLLAVPVRVMASDSVVCIRITDQGNGGAPFPMPETPDLDAKLAGLQSPRGWGLFLIQSMVDEMNITSDESHHTIEMIFHRKDDQNAGHSINHNRTE